MPSGEPGTPGRETREREAAWRRGKLRPGGGVAAEETGRDPTSGVAAPEVAHQAFAALAENVRDYAIFLMDRNGIITFWGEGARFIKGWTKREVEGAHLRLLYPEGGSEDGTAEQHLQQAVEEGEYTGEGHRIRSDGSTFWAGVTLTALRGDDGTLLGFGKVTRDLTARRAADAALKRAHLSAEEARQHAEEASRSKSLFLATMSHEIRTPLNSIMTYADLLDMEVAGPMTEQQREQLKRIRRSSMHLLGIVDDVLDFSRIEAGRIVVSRVTTRIGAAVEGALALVSPQAEANGVDLVDAVSGLTAGESFLGDEERVRQILVNLLGNAIKFTGRGGRVTVSAGLVAEPPPEAHLTGEGPWVCVRVEDTGQGIPPDRLTAIFEAFEQADMKLTRQHGGTGLGLAISRRLARLMGGDLTVRSEVDMGSRFFLWLPAAPEEGLASPTRTPAAAAPGSAGTLRAARDAILADMERILHAYLARLRSDPGTAAAHTLSEAELEDHLASFLADIAETLAELDLAAGVDSEALGDGTAIQRVIAERHGHQRLRLGWSEGELRREFEILREELAAAVRRRLEMRSEETEAVVQLVGEFLRRSEVVSLATYRLAASG